MIDVWCFNGLVNFILDVWCQYPPRRADENRPKSDPSTPPPVQQDFLTPEEETALLAWADRHDGRHWHTPFPGMARRVQHYGYAFNYATRGVDFDRSPPCAPLPLPLGSGLGRGEGEREAASVSVFATVVARLLRKGLLRMVPDQMTLNEYLPCVRFSFLCVVCCVLSCIGFLGGGGQVGCVVVRQSFVGGGPYLTHAYADESINCIQGPGHRGAHRDTRRVSGRAPLPLARRA